GSNPPSGSSTFSQNNVLITGQNSRIVTTGEGRIAEFGYVNLYVEDQGLLDIGDDLYVGGHRSNRGSGTLSITGNSTVRSHGDTFIGYRGGWGTVTLGEGSTLAVGGELTL